MYFRQIISDVCSRRCKSLKSYDIIFFTLGTLNLDKKTFLYTNTTSINWLVDNPTQGYWFGDTLQIWYRRQRRVAQMHTAHADVLIVN